METATAICKTDTRRDAVRAKPGLNGLDYVEVSDDQHTLTAYFLGRAPEGLRPDHFRIEGGQRVQGRHIAIKTIEVIYADDPERDDAVVLQLSASGDFSTYTLRLIGVDNIDLPYDHVNFSFKVNCASELDCVPMPCIDVTAKQAATQVNYLAKDYASFRQLILDRLALVMPEWQERHVPDLGIALVEVLAYTGDYLSYYQDAVATEAYLDTARQRISVRRHARLVDYTLHEGCNARAWVCVEVNGDLVRDNALNPADIFFVTGLNEQLQLPGHVLNEQDLRQAQAGSYEIFEPMQATPIELRQALNEIHFYTWGQRECCLPKGITAATLAGDVPVRASDVLIFEEVIGPKTGNPADADLTHRHAVRLTHVMHGVDPLTNDAITEIAWAMEDALPFALCLSLIGSAPGCAYITHASVARGNVLLVDHGWRVQETPLPSLVPTQSTQQRCDCEGHPSDVQITAGRYRPKLGQHPITCSQPVQPTAPASQTFDQDPRAALPWIRLMGTRADNTTIEPWEPRLDLLASKADDAHFAAETDNEGVAHLRFGDGISGRLPEAATTFAAAYRVGNGVRGNVGTEAISHLVLRGEGVLSGVVVRLRNPLPARGGTEPEPMAEAKLFAPFAFRRGKLALQRAITAEDYARLAERVGAPKVQRSAATLRCTGSWYEADVAIDVVNTWATPPLAAQLRADILGGLHRYRRIGQDVHVVNARYVPIELAMDICVQPHFLRGHVRAALLDVFSNRVRLNGERGFFHPDNLSFGEGIYLSKLIALAAAVPGVASAQVTMLRRQFERANGETEAGVLPIGPGEVAQLDNDPSFPEHGVLRLTLQGGR